MELSGTLATFTFASPAFAERWRCQKPVFAANPVPASSVGTPGFARARKADGTVIADFSVGPGDHEIKLSEVSCSPGAPVKIAAFKFKDRRGMAGAARILRHKAAPRVHDADDLTQPNRGGSRKLPARCPLGDDCRLSDTEISQT